MAHVFGIGNPLENAWDYPSSWIHEQELKSPQTFETEDEEDEFYGAIRQKAYTMNIEWHLRGFALNDLAFYSNPFYAVMKHDKISPFSEVGRALLDYTKKYADPLEHTKNGFSLEDILSLIEIELGPLTPEELYFAEVLFYALVEFDHISNVVAYYKGWLNEETHTHFNPTRLYIRHLPSFGDSFNNPPDLSTIAFINSPNVTSHFFQHEAPFLLDVLPEASFVGFSQFIAHLSQTEKSVWYMRGNDFVTRLPKPLQHFQRTIRNQRRLDRLFKKKITNAAIDFLRFANKYREEYPEVPYVLLKKTEFESMYEAIKEFPSTGNELIYQLLRQQPTGLLYIQELILQLTNSLLYASKE